MPMSPDTVRAGGGGASGIEGSDQPMNCPGGNLRPPMTAPTAYPAWWPDRKKKQGKPLDDSVGGMREIALDYPDALWHWRNENANMISTEADATRRPPNSRETALDRIKAIERIGTTHEKAAESQKTVNRRFLETMLSAPPEVGEEDEQVYDQRVTTARRALNKVRGIDARAKLKS